MNIAPLADVKARFSAYIRKINKEPIIVTKNGRPVAVMLGIADEDDLERILLANSPRFQSVLDAAEKRIKETGGVSHEDIWKMVEVEAKS
jgi:prevent-host-death family protein